MRKVDADVNLDGLMQLGVIPVAHGAHALALTMTDIELIRAERPGFLRFGFNILRGDVLEVAPYGISSFHHGDEQHYRGQPPGSREIHDCNP